MKLSALMVCGLLVTNVGSGGCGSATTNGAGNAPSASNEQAATPTPIAAAQTSAPVITPTLEYRLLGGGTWKAPTGRVLVLDVWASYCQPCRKGFPKLNALAAANPELAIIAVSVDEKDEAAQKFLSEVPTTLQIGRATPDMMQPAPMSLNSLPSLLVFDKQGRERFRASEAFAADYDRLPAIVAQLMAE